MFRYVDALCLLPLYMYPKTNNTHTETHTHIHTRVNARAQEHTPPTHRQTKHTHVKNIYMLHLNVTFNLYI